MRKTMRVTAAVLLFMCALLPRAQAEEYVSSRTRLGNASGDKMTNIHLAVEAINGIWLGYGQQFSFNDAIGPRTEEAGYTMATDGDGEKRWAGGVSQVATTLYLALENTGGISFDALATYGSDFAEDYVEDGDMAVRTGDAAAADDALETYGGNFAEDYVENGDMNVCTDDAAVVDFVFTNYADDMYVEMWVAGGYIYCSLRLGVKEGDAVSRAWNVGNSRGARLLACSCIELNEDMETRSNILLAGDSITDTTLDAAHEFSFNDIVGPRDVDHGYVRAVNGRGVRVVGGGVAQVASAVWLAVEELDCVEILEMLTYGENYNQDYVQDADDAVVTDYTAGLDFRFRYIGDSGSVTLYTYVEDNLLFCEIYQNR